MSLSLNLRLMGGSANVNLEREVSKLFADGEQGTWYDPSVIRSGSCEYAVNDGTTTNYYTTPDSAASSVTGDITIAWSGKLANVAPSVFNVLVDKWGAAGAYSYTLYQNLTGGTLGFGYSPNGTTLVVLTSTVSLASVGITANTRFWLYVQRAASTGVVKFFYSLDGTTYTQLGADVAGTAGNIFDSTAAVGVGIRVAGAQYPLTGKTYRAQVFAGLGIDGTPVVDFNPTRHVCGESSFVASTGETWSLVGAPLITSDDAEYYMFQGSAGTTPVSKIEQPVGLILDKSGRGNHASQPTSAARPVLSARVNLLTKTEDFEDAVWTKINSSVVPNATTAPDGTMTAFKLIESGVNSYHYLRQLANLISGVQYNYTIYAKSAEMSLFRISSFNGSHFVNININLSTGEIFSNGYPGGATIGTPLISNAGNGWWKISITGSPGITASGNIDIYTVDATGNSTHPGVAGNGVYIWHPDFRPADQASLPYQRVNTATDYNTVGFPKYLKFDGVDDFLVTNSINFSATDEMTVWGGVRKLSDATRGIVAELSNSAANPGSFTINAPSNTTDRYAINSTGTVSSSVVTSAAIYSAPVSNVLTHVSDISADSVKLRINGTQVAQSTSDQGTGNYGNYPLYIGMRAGTGLPFNGHIYQLIIRGKTTDERRLKIVEKYTNKKTLAY